MTARAWPRSAQDASALRQLSGVLARSSINPGAATNFRHLVPHGATELRKFGDNARTSAFYRRPSAVNCGRSPNGPAFRSRRYATLSGWGARIRPLRIGLSPHPYRVAWPSASKLPCCRRRTRHARPCPCSDSCWARRRSGRSPRGRPGRRSRTQDRETAGPPRPGRCPRSRSPAVWSGLTPGPWPLSAGSLVSTDRETQSHRDVSRSPAFHQSHDSAGRRRPRGPGVGYPPDQPAITRQRGRTGFPQSLDRSPTATPDGSRSPQAR